MKIFDIDGPLMQTLSKIADLMILNFLTILCCIPIFTVGAALTSLHYMVLKMIRNEDCYIIRGYFKAFKQNFKQSTAVWLIFMVVFAVLLGDYYIVLKSGMEFNYWFKVILGVITLFVIFTVVMVFPLMAKFTNTTIQTIKNALAVSIYMLPKTILMIILYAIPVVVSLFTYKFMPFVIMFGISAPAFASAFLYNGYFKKVEERILAAQAEKEGPKEEEDGEKIFHDKLDETLADSQN